MAKSKVLHSKENRCVICGQERPGLKVKGDRVIGAVRWVKRNITKNEQGYALVICKDDYTKYAKARSSFVKKQIAYTALGVIFAALLVIGSGDKGLAVIFGVIVIVFMYALSLLTYMPAVEIPKETEERLHGTAGAQRGGPAGHKNIYK